ncbi:MAG TPA: Uma2 family endonuclease [Chthoniobacteraceae bacterium]|jgi:Uma2 family endonuclease
MQSPSATAYKMTATEFFQLPVGPPYFQLIDGDLYMSPSPRRYHQKLVHQLAHILQTYLDENPLGELYPAPSDVLFTEDTILNPDLYFVRNERRSILTEQGAEGAPDLVVEILSPSTAKLDLGRKREIYASSGVREMWIVSPRTETIEVFRFAEDPAAPVEVLDATGALSSPLFPGFRLELARLFRA